VEHLSSPSLDLSFTGKGKGICKIYMTLSKCRMEAHMYRRVQYHTFVISALDREVSFMPKLFFNIGER
jgi:hypothetical protein